MTRAPYLAKSGRSASLGRLDPSDDTASVLAIRLPADLRDRIAALAETESRSLSSMARIMLEKGAARVASEHRFRAKAKRKGAGS